MACSHVKDCALFPLFKMKASSQLWITYYCEAHFERCERYRLSHGGKKVPATLLPNGKLLDLAVAPPTR